MLKMFFSHWALSIVHIDGSIYSYIRLGLWKIFVFYDSSKKNSSSYWIVADSIPNELFFLLFNRLYRLAFASMSSIRRLDLIRSLLFGTDNNPRFELLRIFGILGTILDPSKDPFKAIDPLSDDLIEDLNPGALLTYFMASLAFTLFSL